MNPDRPPDPTVTQIAADTQLGPYRIEAPAGSGGMGQVYKARDTRLGRTVAIKIVPEHFSARFEREARAISALNHPNICTLYDVGPNYLVMEYVPGDTLAARLRDGPLPVADLLHYAAQIAGALDNAHAAGVVHRDIKPGNLMITPENNVKILDFGLAKMNEDSAQADAPTTPGTVMGTVAYMSPEQARGEPLDARSDLFSLGAVLYQAAAGRLPFQGPNNAVVMNEIAHKTPPPPSSFRNDLPAGFDQVVARALAKDKRDRFASAAGLFESIEVLRSTRTAPVAAAPQPKRMLWTAAALSLLLGLGAAAYLLWPRSSIDSIAVLPFVNKTNDPEMDLQTDGLTGELINALTQSPNLKVMARTTVFHFKGAAADPRHVGKQLGIRAVLAGQIVRNGGRLTVQADLMDARDGSQVWGRRYDSTTAGLQDLPSEIARNVLSKIHPNDPDRSGAAKRPSTDPQAYELYLRGRRALSEVTSERIRQSQVYFKQAVARDPNFAAAHAGLADSFSYLAFFEIEAPSVFPMAREAAFKAMQLDGSSSVAHTSMGICSSFYEFDWVGSGKYFRRAAELNPSGAWEQHWFAHYLEYLGRWQDAQDQMRKALELDPLNPMLGEDLGFGLYLNGQYDESLAQFRRVVEIDPQNPAAHAMMALVYEALGRRAESLSACQTARKNAGEVGGMVGMVGAIYARAGMTAEARSMIAALQAASRLRYVSPFQEALIHLALGDKDAGFRLLDATVEDRSVAVQFGVMDPTFDPLRRDPRFIRVMKAFRLPEAAWAVNPPGRRKP